MANNFKKIPSVGQPYISKEGDDATAVAYNGSNLEAARDAPRKTMGGGSADTGTKTIVGSGFYQGQIPSGSYEADGVVVLDAEGSELSNSSSSTSDHYYIGFIFQNASDLNNGAQFDKTRAPFFLENCTYIDAKNTKAATTGGAIHPQGCVFSAKNKGDEFFIGKTGDIGSVSANGPLGNYRRTHGLSTYYNLHVRCTLGGPSSQSARCEKNAFVNEGGVCVQYSSTHIENVTDCGHLGQIIMPNGTTYTSFSDPQLEIDYPDFVNNQGNFEITQSISELFNDAENGVFTLPIGSQLIREQFNVGAKGYAKYEKIGRDISIADIIQTPAGSFINDGGRLVLKGGVTQGTLKFPPMLVNGGQFGKMGVGELVTELAFDSDLTQQQEQNRNVPFVTTFADGTDGSNPRRITYGVRFSTLDASQPPVADADFDNGFIATSGEIITHENAEQLVLDNSSRGTGDPDFDETANQLAFTVIWMQQIITINEKM